MFPPPPPLSCERRHGVACGGVQVANLRASRSDEKKFYVYSGTKTLDIRAETQEDRDLWLRILEVRAPACDSL